MPQFHVLLVDDDDSVRDSLTELLKVSGWTVTAVNRAENVSDLLRHSKIDVILSDVYMPGISGLELVKKLPDTDTPPIVLISAHADISTAVEAMQNGAYSFIEKPYQPGHLLSILDRAATQHHTSQQNSRLRKQLGKLTGLDRVLIGESQVMERLRAEINDLAEVDANIFVVGETGTGKELVAHALHELSGRSNGPFVTISCSLLNESNVEDHLYGNIRNLFAKHDYGTLFLDEVCDLIPGVQAKLLRFIETGELLPNPLETTKKVDIRLISASNRDPKKAMDEGILRQDLYYRLYGVRLALPNLRSRPEDILPLLKAFLNEYARLYEIVPPGFTDQDMAELLAYHWPGNVRELRHIAERRILSARRGQGSFTEALRDTLEGEATFHDIPATLREAVAAFERELISRAIHSHQGRMDAVAEALGIGRRTLNEKMNKLNLDKKSIL